MRVAGTIPVALALLAGGVVAAAPASAALPPGCVTAGPQVVCTFSTPTPMASPILFDVPTGVTTLQVTARGASGGAGELALLGNVFPGTAGGPGGTAAAPLTVDPSQNLEIRVGGHGQAGVGAVGGVGGENGGGTGGGANLGGILVAGGGGGGGSEVRVAGSGTPLTADPLLAAGGGGGGGPSIALGVPAGAGGGVSGTDGSPVPGDGEGGTQGPGGSPIGGSRGMGGPGGSFGGGGGGGGKYGGGGALAASGGGGSGFGPAGVVFGVAAAPGDGEVVISYTPAAALPPTPTPTDDDDDGHKKKHKKHHKPTGPSCSIAPAILPSENRFFAGGC